MLVQQWEPLKFALIPGPTKTIRVHNQAVRQFKVRAGEGAADQAGVHIEALVAPSLRSLPSASA